ncbi:peptidoglycan/LPS O-acetylase OafA/YrhL [Pseudarthrobacter oxydans]|uniref:acyltransferase family protein n=1 Tax=Pseudarthrobacter oxydans TaxID=1671 RepID=UPI00277D7970|nr:acyltransferase [Pseudarthrobacter oxydans]MDP9982274.1 peptidoglycan/LPS O-acetylase OafA/YrhL [Pseudarthrobacter oxydans]
MSSNVLPVGSSSSLTPRLHSLTGLRFFAALAVFGFHGLHYGAQGGGFELFAAGMSGVSFFYIVSGFVMGWTSREDDTPSLFYRRRLARIYPSYVMAWAMTLVLMILGQRSIGVVDFLPLTLLQSWVPSETVYFAASAVFWSLSCEAFFYLVFPWIFPALRRLTVRGALTGIVAIVLLLAGLALALAPFFDSSVVFWFLVIFPPVRLLEFVAGILLALLVKRGAQLPFPLWAATSLALGSFVAAGFAPPTFTRVVVTLVPFMLLVWSSAQADLSRTRSVFRNPAIVRLGVWSYGFYLVHTQVMTVWFQGLGFAGIAAGDLSGLPLFAALAGALVAATATAAAIFSWIEQPLERRLRPKNVPVPARRGH